MTKIQFSRFRTCYCSFDCTHWNYGSLPQENTVTETLTGVTYVNWQKNPTKGKDK